MNDTQKSTVLALAILLAISLQVFLVFADQADTPGRVAAEFAKAYHRLDPSMKAFLCSDVKEAAETDPVDELLYTAAEEARQRGFEPGYMRSTFLHVETHTTYTDDDTAVVRLTGAYRRLIHPVFTWVARIFFLGETYHLDRTFHVIRENGQWKICETALPLPAV